MKTKEAWEDGTPKSGGTWDWKVPKPRRGRPPLPPLVRLPKQSPWK